MDANAAHIRQSRPDSGLASKAKVLKIFKVILFLSSADSETVDATRALGRSHWPPERQKVVYLDSLDLHHKQPDFGERQDLSKAIYCCSEG